jgi:WD40 repeat protein
VDVISSLAWNEERGVLYSGSWDKTVKVWRMRDWKCVESIVAHDDAVSSVAVAGDGLLFTGSADSTVKVWAPILGKAEARHVLTQTLTVQQSAAVNALALSTDGSVLYSGSADGSVNVWEREKPIYMNSTLQHAGILKGHGLAVLCLAVAKNLLFSGSADKTIQIWRRDAIGGFHSWLAVLQGHSGPVKTIAATVDVSISNGFLVYSGSMDRSVKVWWFEDNDSSPNQNATYYPPNPVLSPAWVQQKLTC